MHELWCAPAAQHLTLYREREQFLYLRRSGDDAYKAELNKRAKWHRADKPIYTVIVTSITSKQIFYHPTSTVPKEVVAKSPTTAACYGGWFLKKFQLFYNFSISSHHAIGLNSKKNQGTHETLCPTPRLGVHRKTSSREHSPSMAGRQPQSQSQSQH